ncbi:MAG: phosphatidylinositol kinase [Candidatus Dormibacteria bacterium]
MAGEPPDGSARQRRRRELEGARRLRLEEAEAGREQAEGAARRRFNGAMAVAADEGGAPRHAETLRQLRGAEITGIGRVVYSSNAVFLLELAARDPVDPSRPLRAIYKPMRGERPLWDFPTGTLHLREAAAYIADAALELGHVPPTTLRDGPLGPGSVQQFIDVIDRRLDTDEQRALDPALRSIAALDVVLNNADRKSAHLLVAGTGVFAIDNALSFLASPRQRTVLLELGGAPFPDAVSSAMAALAGDAHRRAGLRRHLRRLLHGSEVIAFERRLEALVRRPVYPRLDPWEGRPFEWW